MKLEIELKMNIMPKDILLVTRDKGGLEIGTDGMTKEEWEEIKVAIDTNIDNL